MDEGSIKSDDPSTRAPMLATGFARPTEAEWLELAEKVLKGAPISKLDSTTPGGVTVHPLYTADDRSSDDTGLPGLYPFLRGSLDVGSRTAGDHPSWAMRAEVSESSTSTAADRAVEALERGSTELSLVIAGAEVGPAAGVDDGRGIAIDSVDDLAAALNGVMLDLAPLYARPGERFAEIADLMVELWDRSGVASADARGGFGADPIGTLAATGSLGRGIDAALAELGDLAARTSRTHPGVRSISVDSSAYADAGADEVTELAVILSTAAAYLRACADAGMDVDAACRQIEITTTTDADVFTGVARLRVLRRLWSAVASSCGATPDSIAPRVNVRTARTMMSRRDPWVNLLRVTAASLAAALGGADSLVTMPYDLRLDEQGELGRRMARNTQLLLAEESNLARVVDPMGGSWYLESLTEDLATAVWARFGELEAAGGMPAVLLDGSLAASISAGVTERMGRIATRRQPITGVSEFPDLDETPPGDPGTGGRAAAETTTDASPSGGASTTITPFVPVHWAARFEQLRDRSDAHLSATGSRPKVFLVNIGPVAKHTARATFAQNFYAAGGVEAVTSRTGSDTGFEDPATAVADLMSSGAGLVCICSSDDIYAERAVEFAAAISATGVGPVHLAGKPSELEDALRDAGVETFIHIGVDLVEILTAVHATIGTPEVDH